MSLITITNICCPKVLQSTTGQMQITFNMINVMLQITNDSEIKVENKNLQVGNIHVPPYLYLIAFKVHCYQLISEIYG
jgi:hypothetical protein